jgi:hypothetical protein
VVVSRLREVTLFCERKVMRRSASADSTASFGRCAAIGDTVSLLPADRLSQGVRTRMSRMVMVGCCGADQLLGKRLRCEIPHRCSTKVQALEIYST